MDPALLDDQGRAELLAFYGEVFGWTEGDNTGEPGNPLILYTGAFGEFVYLLPGEPYLTAPALDHFGYQVASLTELHEIVGRAQAYARARRARERDRRARAHDARPGARLHAHERVHRVRAAAHDRAAAPRTPRAKLSGSRASRCSGTAQDDCRPRHASPGARASNCGERRDRSTAPRSRERQRSRAARPRRTRSRATSRTVPTRADPPRGPNGTPMSNAAADDRRDLPADGPPHLRAQQAERAQHCEVAAAASRVALTSACTSTANARSASATLKNAEQPVAPREIDEILRAGVLSRRVRNDRARDQSPLRADRGPVGVAHQVGVAQRGGQQAVDTVEGHVARRCPVARHRRTRGRHPGRRRGSRVRSVPIVDATVSPTPTPSRRRVRAPSTISSAVSGARPATSVGSTIALELVDARARRRAAPLTWIVVTVPSASPRCRDPG